MGTFLAELDISAVVWMQACDLARRTRAAGKTVPATDVLISACARVHGVQVEHADEHFALLSTIR